MFSCFLKDIAAANATSELKHKLFISQKDRDTLIAEVAKLKEELASARAAADTAVETSRAQIESEQKALKDKLVALEAELKKAHAELAAVNAANAKRKSLIGRLF
jgi:chromosome segregation ATPase